MKKEVLVVADLPEFSIIETEDGLDCLTIPNFYTNEQLRRFLRKWDFPATNENIGRLQLGEVVRCSWESRLPNLPVRMRSYSEWTGMSARELFKAWQNGEGLRPLGMVETHIQSERKA